MVELGPRCTFCKHWRVNDPGACDAFPGKGGIPGAILASQVEHFQPYEGDHGIQFELDPNMPEERLELYKARFGDS